MSTNPQSPSQYRNAKPTLGLYACFIVPYSFSTFYFSLFFFLDPVKAPCCLPYYAVLGALGMEVACFMKC